MDRSAESYSSLIRRYRVTGSTEFLDGLSGTSIRLNVRTKRSDLRNVWMEEEHDRSIERKPERQNEFACL